jgi:hypothetical protein
LSLPSTPPAVAGPLCACASPRSTTTTASTTDTVVQRTFVVQRTPVVRACSAEQQNNYDEYKGVFGDFSRIVVQVKLRVLSEYISALPNDRVRSAALCRVVLISLFHVSRLAAAERSTAPGRCCSGMPAAAAVARAAAVLCCATGAVACAVRLRDALCGGVPARRSLCAHLEPAAGTALARRRHWPGQWLHVEALH